jgi:enamine deaminase RidA (YjgF/YER057c/UK114 family)
MADTIQNRLDRLGVTLPAAAAPAANYVSFVRSGKLVFISGQLPMVDGKLAGAGLLGRDLDTAAGKEMARHCAVNVLAQLQAAAGGLENVARLVKISIFVASTPDFTEQHLVGNVASDLLAEVLGEAGKHARAAVGVAVLPLGAPVEVEAIAELA